MVCSIIFVPKAAWNIRFLELSELFLELIELHGEALELDGWQCLGIELAGEEQLPVFSCWSTNL